MTEAIVTVLFLFALKDLYASNRRYKIVEFFVWLILYYSLLSFFAYEIPQIEGNIISFAPYQKRIFWGDSWIYNGGNIFPKASYSISAYVLSRKDYSEGVESIFSPTDLVLGWGPMSNPSIIKEISITQSGRFYNWYSQKLPIPKKDIQYNSANVHMIPGNSNVANTLRNIRIGNIINAAGFLILIEKGDWSWRTSLSRQDYGAGSCEVFWISDLKVTS